MPSGCSVPGCTSNHSKFYESVTAFRFPKNADLKRSWEIAFGNNFNATKSCRICMKHFEEKYYYFDSTHSRRLLTKDAVPTIDMPVLQSINDSSLYEQIIGIITQSAKNFKFSVLNNFICVYILECEDVPNVVNSLKIFQTLNFQFYVNNSKVNPPEAIKFKVIRNTNDSS